MKSIQFNIYRPAIQTGIYTAVLPGEVGGRGCFFYTNVSHSWVQAQLTRQFVANVICAFISISFFLIVFQFSIFVFGRSCDDSRSSWRDIGAFGALGLSRTLMRCTNSRIALHYSVRIARFRRIMWSVRKISSFCKPSSFESVVTSSF